MKCCASLYFILLTFNTLQLGLYKRIWGMGSHDIFGKEAGKTVSLLCASIGWCLGRKKEGKVALLVHVPNSEMHTTRKNIDLGTGAHPDFVYLLFISNSWGEKSLDSTSICCYQGKLLIGAKLVSSTRQDMVILGKDLLHSSTRHGRRRNLVLSLLWR